jgi:hypothetical protein
VNRLSLAVAVLAAIALAPTPARAQDGGAAPATVTKTASAGVVVLDIVETVDEKPSEDMVTTFRLRQHLREAGFVVRTAKPLKIDEEERKAAEKKKAASGAAAPSATAAPVEEKPADLVIRGTVDVHYVKSSVFFGKTVAYEFGATGDLKIEDGKGVEVAKVSETDERGAKERNQACVECEKRIAAWLTVATLKAAPVRERFDAKAKADADAYIAKTEKARGGEKK